MNFKKLPILLMLALLTVAHAQSDYEYVQRFKAEAQNLKAKIERLASSGEVKRTRKAIDDFKNKYYARKDFLNRAIYPESFETVLSELENSLDAKARSISALERANAKIKKLSDYLERLSANYMSVLAELDSIKTQAKKGAAEKENYVRKLNYLKRNIAERDSALTKMLAKLLNVQERNAAGAKGNDLSGEVLQIKENDFLRHLDKLIRDNIRYLDVAEISSDEIFKIYDEQQNLAKNLSKLDSETLGVLLGDYNAAPELTRVKSLAELWGKAIEKKIVFLMNKDFAQFGIELNDSLNIAAWKNSLLDYIETESIKAGNRYERKHKFDAFYNSAWNGVFKRKWLAGLLKAGLITHEEVSTIDSLSLGWERRTEKSPPYFLYILVSVIVIFITVYVAAKGKKTKYLRKAAAQKKKNEYEKRKREKEAEEYKKKMNGKK